MTTTLLQDEEQTFLDALEKKLWTSANKLLPSLDASQYKHVMLGLVFIKYVSDAFELRREEFKAQFANLDHEYYLDPADFGGEDSEEYQAEIAAELEVREVEVGDVLVNSTGVGTLGRLAPVRYLKEQTVFDSHVTVVRADINKITKSFLAGLMLEKESFIENSGAGSTGQTELRKQVLEDIEFANPPLALGEIFETIANPMNKEIAAFEMQQKSLSETRDVLLPKLLSGELKVS